MSYQVAKLIARIAENLPEMSSDVMQGWIENPKSLKKFLTGLCPPNGLALPDIDWHSVYGGLGMSTEYEEFTKTNSVKTDPNLWTIPVLQGVTCNKIVAGLRKLGVKFYLYADDLDKAVPTNDRDLNRDGSYVVSFRRNVEADEEFKNLSANDLAKRDHKGITLLERLLLELGYFLATGKHLDVENITLCTGSRYTGGFVPGVFWASDDRDVCVSWYGPDYSCDYLRSRSVSFPTA